MLKINTSEKLFEIIPALLEPPPMTGTEGKLKIGADDDEDAVLLGV
jgi:hypothetical protein